MIDRDQWARKRRRHWRRWVLLLLCLAVLAAGGYWLYLQFKRETTTVTSTGGGTITQARPILRIPEWGVALRLDDYTADTSYEFLGGNNQYVALSNSQLTNIARGNVGCNNVNTAVKLVRAKPGDSVYGLVQTEADLTNKGIKITDYYYYINKGDGCDPGFGDKEIINTVSVIQTRLSELYIVTIPD